MIYFYICYVNKACDMWLWFFSLPRSPPCYECHAGWRWFQCPKLSLALTWDLNIFTFLHNFLIKHTCFVFVARLVSSAAGQGSAAAGVPDLRGCVTIKKLAFNCFRRDGARLDGVAKYFVFAHIAPSCGVYLRVFDLGTHINKGQMGWKGGLPWLLLVLRKEPMGTDQTEWWRLMNTR